MYSLFIIQINANIYMNNIKSWRLTMKEYAFHGNRYSCNEGKWAEPLWPYIFHISSNNLHLFDILLQALSQSLSPCLLIIRVHTKIVRHIKDVTYQIIEIIKRIMLTWRDQEEDDKKCWDFLHLICLYCPTNLFNGDDYGCIGCSIYLYNVHWQYNYKIIQLFS